VKSTALPLLLYLLLAGIVLAPLADDHIPDSPACDLANHVSGIIEARNALAEGQFPIRVAPTQNGGTRYPIFQFYGNLPYTLGGALHYYLGLDPYRAFRQLVLIALAFGGYFLYRTSLLYTRRRLPALLAGAAFLTAPYLLTNVHARFALPELVACCLLPAVYYGGLRCLLSARWVNVPAAGLAWAALGLTHNVIFLFASLLFGLHALLYARLAGPGRWRLARAGAAYAIGLLLNCWYIVPQAATLNCLQIATYTTPDFVSRHRWLTPIGVLCAPTLVPPGPVPRFMDNERFGLQIGLPTLAAVLLAGYLLWRRTGSDRQRAHLGRLVGLALLAFFLVWSPVDFWAYAPSIFQFVQFSYRILAFVALFGALAFGCVIHALVPAGLSGVQVSIGLAVLYQLSGPYLLPHRATGQTSLAREWRNPQMGRGGANTIYLCDPQKVAAHRVAPAPGGPPLVPHTRTHPETASGAVTQFRTNLAGPTLLQLPVLFYPGLLDVRDNGRPVSHGQLDGFLAVQVPAGEHRIEVGFAGRAWANRVSLLTGLALAGALAWAVAFSWSCALGGLSRGALRETGTVLLVGSGWLLLAGGFNRLDLYPRESICPLLRTVAASSCYDPTFDIEGAFDGDPRTIWVARGGGDATVRVELVRPATLRGVVLHSRVTMLYECWQDVEVVLRREGAEVARQSFTLPDAALRRIQTVSLSPTLTDQIELRFSRPVDRTWTGTTVDPRTVNPGYSEIRLLLD
jgi:hypothetical protein